MAETIGVIGKFLLLAALGYGVLTVCAHFLALSMMFPRPPVKYVMGPDYVTLTAPDGTVLIRPSVIALNRAMTYSDQYSTAKVTEADLLFADMQNDAVDQLTRRLAVLKTLHPTPEQVVPGVAPGAPLPPPPL